MDLLENIISGFTFTVAVLTVYHYLYLVIGFFGKKTSFAPSQKKYRYGVVVCARNEERVIGKLLESIAGQTYPKEKITVFVCADNCTDGTAEICREAGCVVYERKAPPVAKARKGYALEYLFERIAVEYDLQKFDGFAFFDADNVLAPDWFEKMNDAFATGADVVTTYRNTKNFDTNFISAAYGIHFFRSTVTYHRPRQKIGTSTHIAGTGYAVRSDLLKDGWHYTGLTEDTQFTQEMVSRGKRIVFCEDAEFFDEQPHSFKVMFRQRLRWSKGRLVVYLKNGWKNLRGLFTNGNVPKAWANYDIFWYLYPGSLVSALLSVVTFFAGVAASVAAGTGAVRLSAALTPAEIFKYFRLIFIALAYAYLNFTAQAAIVLFRERKHVHCSAAKKILYVFTFFWFDLVNLPISVVSLFLRVRWKPIVHDEAFSYSQIVQKDKREQS